MIGRLVLSLSLILPIVSSFAPTKHHHTLLPRFHEQQQARVFDSLRVRSTTKERTETSDKKKRKHPKVHAPDTKTRNGMMRRRNGESQWTDNRNLNATAQDVENLAAMAVEDLSDLMEEINSRVSNRTAELLGNLTEGMDDKLLRLPEASATELSSFLSDLAKQIQDAQQRELERQLDEIDKRFVRPLEDLAFSDVPLLEAKKTISDKKVTKLMEEYEDDLSSAGRKELILIGANSTLADSRRLRTKDILRNFNVAPFYYSIALLARWVRKAGYPSVYLLSLYKNLASVIKSNTKPRKKDRFAVGEDMQAGWKRTGEIASKGSFARKWAILRRSAEIWAYFSSFYLKDRRITAKYNSGAWTEEKFRAERSKLGAEITQNLLKLGPVRLVVDSHSYLRRILIWRCSDLHQSRTTLLDSY